MNQKKQILGRPIGIWQGCFYLLLAVYGGVILLTFRHYGITVDEGQHVDYGRSVVTWYTSFFQDRTIFSWTNVWLYGGFYDTISYLLAQISPLALYDTRHLCNAAVGMLGVAAAYRLGRVVKGEWVGCLAGLFLLLTPRYYGHAFNNHKDLPFAVFYLWSVYALVQGTGHLPNLRWGWIWKAGILTGLAMGIRVGGVVLLGYMGLFFGLRLFQLWKQGEISDDLSGRIAIVRSVAFRLGAVFLVAYGTMLVFWPWAQTNPVVHPFQALTAFSSFPVKNVRLFEGRYLLSTEIPWYYAPKWVLLTLPEFVLAGLFAGAVYAFFHRHCWTNWSPGTGLLMFSAIFPLGYVVLARMPLYDAARHVLFVVPPLVVMAAVGVGNAADRLKSRWGYGLLVLIGGLMAYTLAEMVRLHPNQYVYFNRLFAGGFQAASSRYQTDYWGNSYKQALHWIEGTYADTASATPIRIASGVASIRSLVQSDRFVYVLNPWAADLYLIGIENERHTLLPGEIIHTVRTQEVPLVYVIRPDSSFREDPFFSSGIYPYRDIGRGDLYRLEGNTTAAMAAYQKALIRHSGDASLHTQIAALYKETGQLQEALLHFQAALELRPPDATAYRNLADCYNHLGRYEEAIPLYQEALALRPNYSASLRNLSRAFFMLARYVEAVQTIQKAIDLWGEVQDLETLGKIYYRSGQIDRAVEIYQGLLQREPENVDYHFSLGVALQKQGREDAALEAYREVLKRNPNHANTCVNLAILFYSRAHFAQAATLFEQAARLTPNDWTVHQGLGQPYERLDRLGAAAGAYRQALVLNPENTHAKARLRALAR